MFSVEWGDDYSCSNHIDRQEIETLLAAGPSGSCCIFLLSPFFTVRPAILLPQFYDGDVLERTVVIIYALLPITVVSQGSPRLLKSNLSTSLNVFPYPTISRTHRFLTLSLLYLRTLTWAKGRQRGRRKTRHSFSHPHACDWGLSDGRLHLHMGQ